MYEVIKSTKMRFPEETLIKVEIYGQTQLYQRALRFWEIRDTKFIFGLKNTHTFIQCLLFVNSSAQTTVHAHQVFHRKWRKPLLPETNMGTIWDTLKKLYIYFFMLGEKLTSKTCGQLTFSWNCSHIGSISYIFVCGVQRDHESQNGQKSVKMSSQWQWTCTVKYFNSRN